MLSKNQIKFIRSLHQAKFRRQHRLFLAEGQKIVDELIGGPFRIQLLCGTAEWVDGRDAALPGGIEVEVVSQKELERISTLQTPNEVLAVVHMQEELEEYRSQMSDLTLALDGIRDPGNLGTLIRTADWFGVSLILCSPDCVDVYNPKVVQASMGSIARVKVIYRDLEETFERNRNAIPVYGAMLEGSSLFEQALSTPAYLLIGSESHGIDKRLVHFVSHPVRIPSYRPANRPGAESLNASIAAAILCAEFRRKS